MSIVVIVIVVAVVRIVGVIGVVQVGTAGETGDEWGTEPVSIEDATTVVAVVVSIGRHFVLCCMLCWMCFLFFRFFRGFLFFGRFGGICWFHNFLDFSVGRNGNAGNGQLLGCCRCGCGG